MPATPILEQLALRAEPLEDGGLRDQWQPTGDGRSPANGLADRNW